MIFVVARLVLAHDRDTIFRGLINKATTTVLFHHIEELEWKKSEINSLNAISNHITKGELTITK